jgi:hypothetical protein
MLNFPKEQGFTTKAPRHQEKPKANSFVVLLAYRLRRYARHKESWWSWWSWCLGGEKI